MTSHSQAPRPPEYAAFLEQVPGAHDRATQALAELVAAVHEQGRAGSLIVQTYLRPLPGGGVSVVIGVRARMPEPAAEPIHMVTTAGGWIGQPAGGPEQLSLLPPVGERESAAVR